MRRTSKGQEAVHARSERQVSGAHLQQNIIRLEAGIERREPAQWDELRVWDPGDG